MRVDPPEPGATSVRMGAAFLRPHSERDHYELVRPVVTVRNEGDRLVTESHSEPIPIGLYRVKRRGDVASGFNPAGPPSELKTSDPRTNRPIELVLVWWPGREA